MLVALLFGNVLFSSLATEKFNHLWCVLVLLFCFLQPKASLFLSCQVKFVIKVYNNILDNRLI